VTAFLYRSGTNARSNTETVSSTTAITYNYTCNSSATANYTAGNATSQLLTLSAASSNPGSGSSTTSSTSSVVSIKLGVGKVNITSTSLTTGGKLIATIAKYQDVAIRGMNITVVNSVANIKLIITKLSILPSTVSFDISGKVYHYINIEKINITDSDINRTNITFAVNKTWLTNNNVSASNMTLYRWANSRWNDLAATKVSEDTSEVFYTASSPGLSVFIIGTKGVQAETPAPTTCAENWSCNDWSACTDDVRTRTCTDSNACGTTANKPSESEQCQTEPVAPPSTPFSLLSYIIVIVVAIVACVLIFLERTKITSYFKKASKKETQYVYKKSS
jgi:PGF-pre-PGF domain-containing protein